MWQWIKTGALSVAALGAVTVAAAEDVEARLERLERVIDAQQREMTEMRAALSGQQYLTQDEAALLIQTEMSALVDERVEAGLAQMRDSSPILTLGKNIEGLDLRGDLRLRAERVEREMDGGGDSNRERYRVRLRVGGVWKSEGWEIGLGLATGNYGAGSGTSTNQTYNDKSIFQTNNINLDYAYARHTWGDLSLTIGQMKKPFVGSAIMWDGDVRQTGIALRYSYQGFFATGGVFTAVHNGADEAEGYLSALQVGYSGSHDQLSYTVATGFFYFTDAVLDDNPEYTPIDVSDYDYGFEIWDLYGELSYALNDVKLKAHGHVLWNTAADLPTGMSGQFSTVPADYEAEDNAIGWTLGLKGTYQKVTLAYYYAHIGADSAFVAVNGGDLGAGIGIESINVKGHAIALSYALTPNLTVKGSAFAVEAIEDTGSYDQGQLYLLEALWTF